MYYAQYSNSQIRTTLVHLFLPILIRSPYHGIRITSTTYQLEQEPSEQEQTIHKIIITATTTDTTTDTTTKSQELEQTKQDPPKNQVYKEQDKEEEKDENENKDEVEDEEDESVNSKQFPSKR